MGRPSSARWPTVTVRHRDTGASVAWSDGEFGGDPELTEASREIATAGGSVVLGPATFEVTDDPRGAAAVMLAACCGRGEILNDSSVLVEEPHGV